jgi:heat shock protein HslJ
MSEKRIEITVSPQGATSIKTSGFTGMSCKDATRELERALGVASKETLTPEFHAGTQTGEQIRQGNS